ncbi:MAG TPA: type III secretion system chaperone [Caulifigura sp.]|jgi:hypothetical protein|nr:type III secretion system chaperone [Caulifigura sp.]
MPESPANGLLAALAQQVGLPALHLDESDCCAVAFDEVVVNFEFDPSCGQLFLYSDLGDAHEGLPEALYRRLLAANLLWKGTGQATLSLDDQAQRFVLAHALPAARMSNVDFVETVESFVNIAEEWRGNIAEGKQPETESAEHSPIDPASANLFV